MSVQALIDAAGRARDRRFAAILLRKAAILIERGGYDPRPLPVTPLLLPLACAGLGALIVRATLSSY